MMIERNETDVPILTDMTRPTCQARQTVGRCKAFRIATFECQHDAALRFALLLTVCGSLWAVWIPSPASAQESVPPSSSVFGIPEPDQQPASPWSKPFRVTTPSRHVATQLDSAGAPTDWNRVPEGGDPWDRDSVPSQQSKDELAARISNEVMASYLAPSPHSVQPLEPPVGWNGVEASLRHASQNCDHLLRRGAVHSARQDVLSGLRLLTRTIDMHRQRWESEPALQQALTALRESEEFEVGTDVASGSLERMVGQHATPVLQNRDLLDASPAIAAQHYRAYARDGFLVAADEHPWAADLIFALGKTFERESQLSPSRQLVLLQHATVCYQAAFAIAPEREQVSSHLGSTLLQLDRVEEAMVALKASIDSGPSSTAWRNMAEAHRRRGEFDAAREAVHLAEVAARSEVGISPERPEITEISAEEFAMISPPNAFESPKNANEGSPHRVPPAAVPTANRGWLPKFLR